MLLLSTYSTSVHHVFLVLCTCILYCFQGEDIFSDWDCAVMYLIHFWTALSCTVLGVLSCIDETVLSVPFRLCLMYCWGLCRRVFTILYCPIIYLSKNLLSILTCTFCQLFFLNFTVMHSSIQEYTVMYCAEMCLVFFISYSAVLQCWGLCCSVLSGLCSHVCTAQGCAGKYALYLDCAIMSCSGICFQTVPDCIVKIFSGLLRTPASSLIHYNKSCLATCYCKGLFCLVLCCPVLFRIALSCTQYCMVIFFWTEFF